MYIMKLTIITIAILLCGYVSVAQTVFKKDNVVLTVGAYGAATTENGFSRQSMVYLPADETYISVMRSNEKTTFATYNQKLKVVDSKDVANVPLPDKTNYLRSEIIDGKFYHIRTLRDFHLKKMDFYFLGYDVNTRRADKAKVFNFVEADFGSDFQVLRRDNEFRYELYDSATKILFSYSYLGKKNSDKKSYFATSQVAFDFTTGKQIWSGGIIEPYDKEKASQILTAIDDNGTTYALFKINNEKGSIATKEGTPDYACELMKYTPYGKFESILTYRPTKFTIIHEERISNDGMLTMAGTYKDKDGEGVKGVYTVRIDLNSRKVVYERYFDFTDEMVNYLMLDKKGQKGKDYGVNNLFGVDNVTFDDNGGFVYAAEVTYTLGGKDDIQFIYNDIVAMRVSNNGKLEWAKVIPKRQVNNGSYTTTYYNGKDYFFYMDNSSNTTASVAAIPAIFKKSEPFTLHYTTIDNAGDITTGNLGPIDPGIIDYLDIDRSIKVADNIIIGSGLLTGYSIKID